MNNDMHLPDLQQSEPQPVSSPPLQESSSQPVRRIGTLTMGICLIATGVLGIVSLFIPQFPIEKVAKFMPLILVLLGVEILLTCLTRKGCRLKYDFLSGVVCFILIFCGFAGIMLSRTITYWGPEKYRQEQQVKEHLYTDCYYALQGDPDISGLSVEVSLLETLPKKEVSYQDLTSADRTTADIQISSRVKDEPSFAKACRQALDKLSTVDTNFQQIRFISTDHSYQLNLNGRLQQELSEQQLELLVASKK